LVTTRCRRPGRQQRLAEPGTLTVGAGEAVVDVDPVGLDTQAEQSVALSSQACLIGRASGVPDKAARSWRTSRGWPVVPHNAADSSTGSADLNNKKLPTRGYKGSSPNRIGIRLRGRNGLDPRGRRPALESHYAAEWGRSAGTERVH
jgi:hypothetical protein